MFFNNIKLHDPAHCKKLLDFNSGNHKVTFGDPFKSYDIYFLRILDNSRPFSKKHFFFFFNLAGPRNAEIFFARKFDVKKKIESMAIVFPYK